LIFNVKYKNYEGNFSVEIKFSRHAERTAKLYNVSKPTILEIMQEKIYLNGFMKL